MEPIVREFFVLTVGRAIYKATMTEDDQPAKVEKIDQIEETKVPIGATLKNGFYLGITREIGAVVYHGKGKIGDSLQPAWEVNTDFYGGHTSPIAGLFLEEENARGALRPDLIAWDWRYMTQTIITLQQIGRNHPLFSIDPPVWELVEGALNFAKDYAS